MAAHYLVDQFHSPILNSSLIDVKNEPSGQSLVNGTFVVRVPDQVSVQNPSDLNDLLNKKYAGLLASLAGFTVVVFDDLLDATGVSTANSSLVKLGERSTVALGATGVFQSNTVALSGAPDQAVVTWETFTYTDADDKQDRLQRTYVEADPDDYTCDVSFDNGANFNSVTDGGVVSIPVPQQGTNFIIRFTNGGAASFIGSWALIF